MAARRKQSTFKSLSVSSGQHWLIQPPALRDLIATTNDRELPANPEALSPAAEAEDGDTNFLAIRNGIAIITARGPMFRYSSWITSYFGIATYEDIERAFLCARDNESVKHIVFDIDTPGGHVNGCNELADVIRAVSAVKPVIAVVSGTCASAGYWLASSANSIVVGATAILGSIGCVCTYLDDREMLKQLGLKEYEIVSTQSPNKRPDLATKEGYAQVQKVIDDLAAVFISSVAANRGVSVDTVLKDFGQGGEFVGQAAVDAGLADEIGTIEDVIETLSSSEFVRPSSSHNVIIDSNSASNSDAKPGSEVARLNVIASRLASRSTRACSDGETRCEGCDPENPGDDCPLENEDEDMAAATTTPAPNPPAPAAPAPNAAADERARISGILASEHAKGREALAQHLAFAPEGYSVDAAVGILKASPAAQAAPPPAPEAKPRNALEEAMAAQPKPTLVPGSAGAEEAAKSEADKDVEAAQKLAASLFGKPVK